MGCEVGRRNIRMCRIQVQLFLQTCTFLIHRPVHVHVGMHHDIIPFDLEMIAV